MLRIAKTTPGVLDLSAVKDEHGIPVTLVGPSHRDVPDHEENNPVLQRIVELRWVTVSKVSVEMPDSPASGTSSGLEPASDPPPPSLAPVPDAPSQPDPAVVAEPDPPAFDSPQQQQQIDPDPPAAVAEPMPVGSNPIPPTAAPELTSTDGSPNTQGEVSTTGVVDVAPSPATKPERRSSRRS
jgi:hypothetical protein